MIASQIFALNSVTEIIYIDTFALVTHSDFYCGQLSPVIRNIK